MKGHKPYKVCDLSNKRPIRGHPTVACVLAVGLTLASIFPTTVCAEEVGAQVTETSEQLKSTVLENKDLIEKIVKETLLERGVDGSDQILAEQVRSEVEQKIASGEINLKDYRDSTVGEDNTKADTPAKEVTATDHASADEVLSDEDISKSNSSLRLIVSSESELSEFYGAISVDHYDGMYFLTYETTDAMEVAYNNFLTNGYVVEKDISLDPIQKEETPEDDIKEEVTDTEVTDTKEDDSAEVTPKIESVEDHKTIVAVIDTGLSDITNDDALKDRVIEGTSTIGDSYVDDNGHGTAVAKIIAEDTAGENVYILPIKALDENGKGTVASVALAIKYAKEHGADVINLSLSGKGTSNILTNAINDCYNNGITVVTAAGNDNDDALAYMPGNIDTAINIAAADKDADGNIIPTTYTNHGEAIDFAAIGTYKLTVVKDDIPLETELRGTSIASAHVSAYVALMKQINSTVDGVVDEVSESDVYASLVESANTFDGNIEPNYFGKGYLSKEGLIFKKSDKEDEKKDTDKEEKEADADQGMTSSGGTWEVLCNNSGWGQFNAWWNNSSSCAQAVYDTVNTAYNYYRFDTLILHIQDACVFDTQIMVPAGKTLIIYGGNSIWTGDANKRIDWSKVGNGANSDGIKGTCIGAGNNATLEVHNVNFYDWTTTTANFNEAPGCIGTCDDIRNTYATLKADRCNFFSQNHWWSVSAGKAGSWVTNCYFNNNASARSHGALCIVGGADVTDCTFDGKKGCSNSRALTIENNGGTTRITNCSIKNYGGWNPAVEADGTVIIQNCVINNGSNRVGDADIAISHSNGTLNIANSEVCGAKVSGIKTASNSTVNISNCNIYSNAYGISNNGTINIRSDYDQSQYYNRYADLRNTFGNDDTKLWNHWINNGMSEGRVASNNCSTKIHNNSSYGIFNSGTVNMPGGSIYSNSYGIYSNSGTVNISGGTIYNNNNQYPANIEWAKGAGVMNDGDNATTNISGGTIRDNGWGNVWNNNGTLNVTGGTISQTDGQNQTTSFGVWNNTTANISGSADIYGYTTNSNGNVAAAIRNCNTLTVKSKDNRSPSIHGSTFGIDTSSGTTTFEDGAVYENNTGFYCNTGATVNFKKGTVKDNISYGLNNNGITNMTGGTFTGNNIGIRNSAGTTNMSDGAITKSKQMNIEVYDGTVNFNGGSITESGNKGYGIEIQNNGSATLNQSANIGINTLGGVRVWANGVGRYNVYKGATTAVGSNGSDIGVYLAAGASVTVHDDLTSDIKIASMDRYLGKVIASCDNKEVANSAKDHLIVTSNASFTKTTANSKSSEDYGKEVVFRQGNGSNGGNNTKVVVSQVETITLDANADTMIFPSGYASDYATAKVNAGDQSDTRITLSTYWGEKLSENISASAYWNGLEAPFVEKLGWTKTKDGEATYKTDLSDYTAYDDDTLYAKWNAIFFKMKSNVNAPEGNTANGGWGTVTTHNGDTKYQTAKLASCEGYSFMGWFTKANGGEMIYDHDGNIVRNTSITDANGCRIYKGKNGETVNLYAHWTTFDVLDKSAKIGTTLIPLGNGDKTVIATYAGQNIYTDSYNSPYGSNVYVKTKTRTINGDTAPNIDKIWVKVINTSDQSQFKEYVLYDETDGTDLYNEETLLDTVKDLPGAMDLTYEIHVRNTYGLEKIVKVYTSREIELYTTIEKVDTDLNNASDDRFSAGTRGIIHVYTTGWVDDFNFTFPNVMYQSWEYDRSLGQPVMDPSANDVFGFTDIDPNMSNYAIASYPYAVRMVTDTENYKTYGESGFIRCYDFYFWIPLSISNPSNPDSITVDQDTVWKIKTTARKYYDSKPVYNNGELTGTTTRHVTATVSSVVAAGGTPDKVSDYFRTTIKKVD